MAPASNQYVLGRPFVKQATLTLPNGQHFTVVADNLSVAHPYVGQVTLNGQPLARTYLTHAEILAGGELRFLMQATPVTEPVPPEARPFSMTAHNAPSTTN